MKDVISVDSALQNLAMAVAEVQKRGAKQYDWRGKDVERCKRDLHSVLISKLPEKKPEKPEGYPDQWYRGWDSAIDDVKAVLDKLFQEDTK